MATATRTGKVDPRVIVELQDTPDPDTGQFRSIGAIRNILEAEHGIRMTRAGVRQAAIRYRSRENLPPAPAVQGHFPPGWGPLPDEIHQSDATAFALHRIARRELARQNGGEAKFEETELRKVAAFERLLSRMGPATVVAWHAKANGGAGGWVLRQRVEGEEVWYGVMAVRPYPTAD